MPSASPPRQPKTSETNPAEIPTSFFRAAVVFAAATWATFSLLGAFGMKGSVEQFGAAVVIACVLTPIALFLIDGWWKLLAREK